MVTVDSETPQIYNYDSVDSTNVVLHALAEQGAASGSVVVAEEQTAGRGRGQKKWSSPRGGLWCSYLWRRRFSPRQNAQISIAIGLATRAVIEQSCGLEAFLAWPNDVMVNDKKIAGIMSEYRDTPGYLIAGIGINVNVTSEHMPQQVEKPATSVRIETGRDFDNADLLELLQTKLAHYLNSSRDDVVSEYARWAYWPTGQKVWLRTIEEGRTLEGTVIGVNMDTGEFLVRGVDHQDHAFTAGTIEVRAV